MTIAELPHQLTLPTSGRGGALYPFTGLLLDPIFAAVAMAASGVTVVSNALRLRGFRAPNLREPPPSGRRLPAPA